MPIQHSVSGHALTDVLERVLDKGIVITGDIKITLVNTELLTIQIRLLIASVDRAKELGIDWWNHQPTWSSPPTADYSQRSLVEEQRKQIETLQKRLDSLESTQKEELSTLKKQLEVVPPKKKKWRF
ncbi:MAG: gas vesicle protein [Candidatus Brocadiales bacterium]|nr:gas vesicle protein [Candidatus Brocadiales bacterium]